MIVHTHRIVPELGHYLLLADYGREGISVVNQAHTPTELLVWSTRNNPGPELTIVKLVEVDVLTLAEVDTPA